MRARGSFFSIRVGKLWPLVAAGIFCAVLFSSLPAQALLDKSKYTDSEFVAFAFSKLGNVPPDYQAWVEDMEVYQKAKPFDRQEIEQQATVRLQQGYYNYTPEDDLISIVADVQISWNPKDFANSEAGSDQYLNYKIAFGEAAGRDKADPYFPFKVGKFWVALIPKDIGGFLNLSLPAPQAFDMLKKMFGHSDNIRASGRNAIIELKLRPMAVNTKEPVQVDGEVYWLMLADIANLTIWNAERDKMIWSYDAPWYQSRDSKAMMDLFDK
jgi:hypothetical protein